MRWCSKRTEMVFLTCLKFASPAWGKLWFLAKEATESLRCADSPSEERKGMYELPTRPLQFGLGFWPRLRGRVFLRRANERTLSNTDEAEIAVPAPPGCLRDNNRPRVSSLQSLTLPAPSRSQRFSFPTPKRKPSNSRSNFSQWPAMVSANCGNSTRRVRARRMRQRRNRDERRAPQGDLREAPPRRVRAGASGGYRDFRNST